MTVTIFLLGLALVVRLTRLLTTDSITQPIRDRIEAAGNKGADWDWVDSETGDGVIVYPKPVRQAVYRFLTKLLDCDWCSSVWVAVPVALWVVMGWLPTLLLVAGSAAAFSYAAGILGQLTSLLDHEH